MSALINLVYTIFVVGFLSVSTKWMMNRLVICILILVSFLGCLMSILGMISII